MSHFSFELKFAVAMTTGCTKT